MDGTQLSFFDDIGGVDMIAEALTNVGTIFNKAVGMIQGNDVAMAFIGISLAGAGIGLFRRVIHSR